jgi:hypothetical protein
MQSLRRNQGLVYLLREHTNRRRHPMDAEQAYRVTGWGEANSDFNDTKICYWKNGNDWMLYLPKCGAGNLKLHTVIEHEDGTITVTPSILVTGHEKGEKIIRHGYLTKGVWQEV